MEGKVLKPIPGTGYYVGETAKFEKKKFDEYFELGYIEPSKEAVETAAAKGKESADIKAKK